MSSSKIIRQGGEGQLTVVLGELESMVASQPAKTAHGGFRSINLGGYEPDDQEPEEELPPPPPMMLEEEAHRLIEEARREGLKEGREKAEAELAKVGEALAKALVQIGELRGQVLHEAEADLLKLAVAIARKVVLKELAADPGTLARLVRAAVEVAVDGDEVLVRLNPEDHAVAESCQEFKEMLRECPQVSIKADPDLPQAGCLVETVRGNIDAGLDAQLEEIYRGLAEERSGRRELTGEE